VNRRERRQTARKVRAGHARVETECGCTHLGLLVFEGHCSECGQAYVTEGWMPTSGLIGDSREMGYSACPTPGCDGDLHGVGVIMATDHL
jgi:hypothetical protein